jgi:hypothetical protein
MATVDRIRDKMVRWRKFTRTTLIVEDSKDTAKEPAEAKTALRRPSVLKDITPLAIDKVEDEPLSPVKKVMFAEENKTEKKTQIAKPKQHLSEEEVKMRIKQLAKEFVKSKLDKMRCSVQFYIWLSQNFTD